MLLVLCIGLLLSPLIFWPTAPVPFEIPRVWFIQRWIEVLLFLGFMSLAKPMISKKIDRGLLILILGFMIVALLASLAGVDFTKSLWGNYYRSDGLFTLFHLVGLCFLLVLFWQEKWRKYLAASISLGAFATSLWAMVSGIRLYVLNDVSVMHWIDNAIGVSFGQPKFLAGYILVCLPFTIYLLKISKVKWQRTFFLSSIIIQTIAIAFTKSWAAALGIGLLTVLVILSCTNFQRSKVIIFGLIFLVFASFGIIGRLHQDKGFVAEERERIFRKVIMATIKRPILGWGWANVDYAFESVDWPIHLDKDVYVDKAHSTILEIFVTTGIAGLIIYLLILLKLGQRLISWLKIKSKNYLWHETLFLVFMLYVFHSQTNVISIGEEIVFWIILGISSA